MALSRQALKAYDDSLSRVEAAASGYVRKRVGAYLSRFPGATVADAREFAKEAVGQAVDAYGDAASEAACELYDALAEAAGERLPAAAVDTSDVSGFIDDEVRYQAGKLSEGAPTAFAEGAAACARDQVSRRANATMMRNASRDKVRYARVPMGAETCTFCAMLVSRGYAYRSARSAGEGSHWHPNCRCKVVPSTAGPVEGYDPDEWAERWHAMEDIDADPRLTAAQKLEVKSRISGGGLPAGFALRFLNQSDALYRYAEKIKPIDGYEDVCIHSDGLSFYYTDSNADTDSVRWLSITPRELANSLREAPGYHGGNIRLIACDSGFNGKESAAQFLANELGVDVLAPDKTAMVDGNGVMHLADTRSEFMKIDAGIIEESGKWIVFKPER